jgi:hypothetical protein
MKQIKIDSNTCTCPKCNSDWKGDDIYEYFRNSEYYKDKSDEEILEIAGSYGWTEDNPKTFNKLIGIEIQGEYDGVLYWKCPDCESYWGRFSGNEVTNLENVDHSIERNAMYSRPYTHN